MFQQSMIVMVCLDACEGVFLGMHWIGWSPYTQMVLQHWELESVQILNRPHCLRIFMYVYTKKILVVWVGSSVCLFFLKLVGQRKSTIHLETGLLTDEVSIESGFFTRIYACEL